MLLKCICFNDDLKSLVSSANKFNTYSTCRLSCLLSTGRITFITIHDSGDSTKDLSKSKVLISVDCLYVRAATPLDYSRCLAAAE